VRRSVRALFAFVAVVMAVACSHAAPQGAPTVPSEAPAEVLVETLNESLRGELLRFDDDAIALSIEGGPVEVRREELVSVARSPTEGDQDGATTPVGVVELVDGSIVPYTSHSIDGEKLRLEMMAGNANAWRVETALDAVVSWRTAPASSAAIDRQWREVVGRTSTSDLVVVLRGEGASIDFVEGVIERVDGAGVRFVLEGEGVDVVWPRVFGLVFFRPSPPNSAETTALEGAATRVVIEGEAGLRLAGDSVELDGDHLALSSGSLRAAVRLDTVRRIDCSAGKIAYVSSLPVLRCEGVPRFGGAAALPATPVADRALGGGPITLRFPDPRAPEGWPGLWILKRYEHGWAVRSRGVVELRLPAGARRLRGWVGIDPATAAAGRLVARVVVDGRTLVEAPIDAQTAPIAIDESLDESAKGAESAERTLTLEVDYGENLDTGDHAHFADLRVTR
jgi:hypothetical protein